MNLMALLEVLIALCVIAYLLEAFVEDYRLRKAIKLIVVLAALLWLAQRHGLMRTF